ncbi:MAG: hypothetical protein H7Y01_04830 [Ferruginibacter sp.]|nr:hypothetical protein [Chitinophagaceae bacterium]
MEVHHHSRTPRNKWAHYFWEFFMLFLAVTLGFIVENWREHRIELKREKKFIQSLSRDFQADTARLHLFQLRRLLKIQQCDSLIYQLSHPGATADNSFIYYTARRISRRDHFYPLDATLQQLKGVSGFRVIHSQEVLDSISAYEILLKLNNENIEVEEKELTEYTDKAAKIFNVNVFQEITKENDIKRPEGNPSLLTHDPIAINELCIKLHYWKRTSLTIVEGLTRLQSSAKNLVALIKEKYHLK